MPPSSGVRPVSPAALEAWRARSPASDWEDEPDTAVRGVTPELLEALRRIAPKPRRSALPWVFLLALATVAIAVGASPVAREVAHSWAIEHGLLAPSAVTPESPSSTGSTPRSP